MKLKELEMLMQVQARSGAAETTLCRRRRRRRHSAAAAEASPLPTPPQDIAPFEDPKIELEQYPTGAHLASRLLFTVRAVQCGLQAAPCTHTLSPATCPLPPHADSG